MPQDLRITLRNFEKGIDWRNAVKAPRPNAAVGAVTQEAARVLLSSLSRTRAGTLIGSIQEVAGPPSAGVTTVGRIGGAVVPGRVVEFTIALGPAGNVGALVQVGASGGVYWWVRPGFVQLGLWGSVGVGATSNMGFTAGGQLSVWYGGASTVFSGESVGVSVDVSIGAATVTGMLFFSVPPGGLLLTPGMRHPPTFPPGWTPTLIGLGFGLGVGFSVLPVDITVSPSTTWIKPL